MDILNFYFILSEYARFYILDRMRYNRSKMGYSHYWYREKEISKSVFLKIKEDFIKMLPTFKLYGIKLADGHGEGDPIITNDEIRLNGADNCGHTKNDKISIPWPSTNIKKGNTLKSEKAITGGWFAGVTLDQRCCNGSCSYESFVFDRVIYQGSPIEKLSYIDRNNKRVYTPESEVGKYFGCIKTAFRPYDLVVNCFLIIAQYYLGDKIIISSDGESQHWIEGVELCNNILGYGHDFKLNVDRKTVKQYMEKIEGINYS